MMSRTLQWILAGACVLLGSGAGGAFFLFIHSSAYRRYRLELLLGDPAQLLQVDPLKLALACLILIMVLGGLVWLAVLSIGSLRKTEKEKDK
jgi:uncharacterized membrane protein